MLEKLTKDEAISENAKSKIMGGLARNCLRVCADNCNFNGGATWENLRSVSGEASGIVPPKN